MLDLGVRPGHGAVLPAILVTVAVIAGAPWVGVHPPLALAAVVDNTVNVGFGPFARND